MRPRRVAAWALVAAATAAVTTVVAPGPAAIPPVTRAAPPLPPPVRPLFVPGRPRPAAREVARWAPVTRAAVARRAPAAGAAPLARVPATTPEGTTNIVLAVGHRTDRAGRPWVRVRLAALPNGRTGWLPRSALGGYGTVDTRLVVDTRRLTATLSRRGRAIFRARVAVGRRRWPTPRGRFYIRNRLTRYASAAYGPLAFGTSARSAHATDWPDGAYIGIHGTDRPELIPGRVSHGCIRLRNADILALGRLMPVGTPVTIT